MEIRPETKLDVTVLFKKVSKPAKVEKPEKSAKDKPAR